MTTADLQALDRRYVWHPFTHMKAWVADESLVITRAESVYLFDSDGRRYFDGTASLWCNVHGHRVPKIDAAVRDQLDRVAHTTLLGLTNEPATLLAERLVRVAPPGLAKVFYSDSGATATEIAFKLAAQYWWNLGRPEKAEFVGLAEAYHGDTVGAMSVGHTSAFHKPYLPLLFKVHFAPAPTPYRFAGTPRQCAADALAKLETILRAHHATIAAICVEPLVMGAAGMVVQPAGYLRGVRELADRYGVLLIADEVATGFGRTGRMFACDHEAVTPDLLCLGKGISGGYLPLAATLTTQAIFDAFLGEPHEGKTFFHGHTYTGNPLACAAALASLELFEETDLLAHVNAVAAEFAAMLDGLKSLPVVGDVRQCGLMTGIELVADKSSATPFDPKRRTGAAVCQRLRRRGVLLRPLGDTIVINPPLVATAAQLREVVDALQSELIQLEASPAEAHPVGHVVAGRFLMRRPFLFGCLVVVCVDVGACSSTRSAAVSPTRQTDRTLDLAIDGEGFFIVQTPAGGFLFTRHGELSVGATGEIVNDDGYRLFPTINVTAANKSMTIDGGGVVRLQTPDGPSEVAGRIVLARFADPKKLDRDGVYNLPTAESGDPVTGKPGSNGLGSILVGRVEDVAP